MGSLSGHVIPGIFLSLLGLWWIINICVRYYKARATGTVFFSTLCFSSPILCCKKLPIDLIILLGICCLALTGQLLAIQTTKPSTSLGQGEYYEHAVMFAIIILMTLLELLRRYKFPLPSGFEYLAALVAFAIFAMVLFLHAHGGTPIHRHVHKLLTLAVVALCVSLCFEMGYRHSFLAAISRGYMTLLVGTWIIQVGLFLYPTKNMSVWTGEDYSEITLSSMIFSWYCAGIFGFLSLLVVNVALCYKNTDSHQFEPENSSAQNLEADKLFVNGV